MIPSPSEALKENLQRRAHELDRYKCMVIAEILEYIKKYYVGSRLSTSTISISQEIMDDIIQVFAKAGWKLVITHWNSKTGLSIEAANEIQP